VGSTVTAALVTGRTYRVRFVGTLQSSVASDSGNVRLREDSVAGTQINLVRVALSESNAGFLAMVEGEYTAVSTGNKTFVATGVRNTGTGNLLFPAAATQPRQLYVDYIRN
jgi:hypothetical protein